MLLALSSLYFPPCNPAQSGGCFSTSSSPRGTARCLLRRWCPPTIRRCSSPTPEWCSSSASSSARSSATTSGPRPARSACAPAASTTIWSRSGTPSGTTPSSRCWATSPSATTSSARRSRTPGSSSPVRPISASHPIVSGLRCITPMIRPGLCGGRSRACRIIGSMAWATRTTSGRWATLGPVGRARRSMWIWSGRTGGQADRRTR